MKDIVIGTITATVHDAKYEYNRKSMITLSPEHFDAKFINKMNAKFIAEAANKGLYLDNTSINVEIPVDEEESTQKKLKDAEKALQQKNTDWYKEKKRADEAEARVKVLEEFIPAAQIPDIPEDLLAEDDEA